MEKEIKRKKPKKSEGKSERRRTWDSGENKRIKKRI